MSSNALYKKSGTALAVSALLMSFCSISNADILMQNSFLQLLNVGANSDGFSSGQLIRFGATSVTPNGTGGTTGVASTVNTATGQRVSYSINYNPGPAIPNFFSRNIAYNANLLDPWTLRFSNSGSSVQTTLALPAGATELPFVRNIILSGTSTNPTYSWTPPAGVNVNGYRINIYDKSLITTGNNGEVASRNLPPNVTSYTVQASDFTVPGYQLQTNHTYSIEIGALQTRDGGSTNLGNNNVYAISRVYQDFTTSNVAPVSWPTFIASAFVETAHADTGASIGNMVNYYRDNAYVSQSELAQECASNIANPACDNAATLQQQADEGAAKFAADAGQVAVAAVNAGNGVGLGASNVDMSIWDSTSLGQFFNFAGLLDTVETDLSNAIEFFETIHPRPAVESLMAMQDGAAASAPIILNSVSGVFSWGDDGASKWLLSDLKLNVDIAKDYFNDLAIGQNLVTIGGLIPSSSNSFGVFTVDDLVDPPGYNTVSLSFRNIDVISNSVPEPGSYALVGLGFIGVIALRRRKQT